MPAVISPFPQMLFELITVTNKLIDHGYPKAAADIVNLAAISPPCSPPPPVQSPHWCPLSSPPPSLPTKRRRRRHRKRRSSSSSPSSSSASSPLISAEVSQLISSITKLPVTSAIDLEWEEFSKPEGKSKHVADLVDTCVDVATKSSDHPSEDSVLPSIAQGMQNLLAIAAATNISFKEAELIKALLAVSNIPKEEKTNAEISRTERAFKEAQEMNKLVTSVDKLDTRRSARISPYEPRKFDREDFPGLGDREVVFLTQVSPPSVNFKALGFGPRFLPRPELFPVQGCSQDPAIYLCVEGDDCRSSKHHYRRSDRRPDVTPYPPWHIGTAHSEPCPFGTLPGLETDFGITDVPEKLFGWKYESGTGRDTKWVMTSEVKVPSFSAKSRLLDPNPLSGPRSIPGAQKANESESVVTNALVDDPQPPLIKCEKIPAPTVMAAKLSPTTWCSAPPPSAPPMFERRFPKLERRRRLSS